MRASSPSVLILARTSPAMLMPHKAIRREVSKTPYVCWSCRLKPQASHRSTPPNTRRVATSHAGVDGRRSPERRERSRGNRGRLHQSSADRGLHFYHTSKHSKQQVAAATAQDAPIPPSDLSGFHAHDTLKTGGIRDQLRQWQELHGKNLDAQYKVLEQTNDTFSGEASNLTRLHDPSMSLRQEAEREEDEQRSIAHFSRTSELDDGSSLNNRFLKMGDLIELEFPRSERESILAVFVRRVINGSQILTMQGRWMVIPERSVQYSIVSSKLLRSTRGASYVQAYTLNCIPVARMDVSKACRTCDRLSADTARCFRGPTTGGAFVHRRSVGSQSCRGPSGQSNGAVPHGEPRGLSQALSCTGQCTFDPCSRH